MEDEPSEGELTRPPDERLMLRFKQGDREKDILDRRFLEDRRKEQS